MLDHFIVRVEERADAEIFVAQGALHTQLRGRHLPKQTNTRWQWAAGSCGVLQHGGGVSVGCLADVDGAAGTY